MNQKKQANQKKLFRGKIGKIQNSQAKLETFACFLFWFTVFVFCLRSFISDSLAFFFRLTIS